MKYTEWDDIEYGKHYMVYEYSRGSHMGPPYKGVVVWKFTENLSLNSVDHMVGSSPIGCHSAKGPSGIWAYWEILDKSPHVYHLKHQPTLVFFELTESELIEHVVLEVI
jgi:hypothetical protein